MSSSQVLRVVAEGLNVRSAPNLQGKVIHILARHELVTQISVSGDEYWSKVACKGGIEGWAANKYLQVHSANAIGSAYPWFEIAQSEIGVREIVGRGDNPRIVEYHHSTTLDAGSASLDETPWCSSFVNWCVERAGYAGTDSAWARSWLNWGVPTAQPTVGTIAIFTRDGGGHVGFYVSENEGEVQVLGGNQRDAVNIAHYPKKDLLGYRNPHFTSA